MAEHRDTLQTGVSAHSCKLRNQRAFWQSQDAAWSTCGTGSLGTLCLQASLGVQRSSRGSASHGLASSCCAAFRRSEIGHVISVHRDGFCQASSVSYAASSQHCINKHLTLLASSMPQCWEPWKNEANKLVRRSKPFLKGPESVTISHDSGNYGQLWLGAGSSKRRRLQRRRAGACWQRGMQQQANTSLQAALDSLGLRLHGCESGSVVAASAILLSPRRLLLAVKAEAILACLARQLTPGV